MASLTGSTIAQSYEQLLSLPDGGLDGNNLVAITDGDSSTAIGMKVATNKIEIIPGSNDANAFEVSQADGTAVLTVNTSTVGATLIGTLTVGVDDTGHDVKFFGATATNGYMLWDESTDDLILGSSSKMGIGTVSPGTSSHNFGGQHNLTLGGATTNSFSVLEIAGNDADDNAYIGVIEFVNKNNSDAASGTSEGISAISTVVQTDDTNAGDDSGGEMQFWTKALAGNLAERMRIDSTGKVGIGTNAPGQLLHVASAGNAYIAIDADSTGAGTDNAGLLLQEAGNDMWTIRNEGNSSNRLAILDEGFDDGVQLAQNGSGFSDISDERTKTDLVTITDAVDKINSLRAVNFKWKYGSEERRTKNNIGIIAQDVYKVLPEAVTIPEEDYKVVDHPKWEGEKQAQNVWTVDKGKLTILLIKAVQELSSQVTDLKKEIKDLKG